jgi:cell shape-determining protein MreC
MEKYKPKYYIESEKVKVKKYKCLNITEDELKAILNGQEQMRSDAESSDEDYAEWASEQVKLINSFYRKVKSL